jgi:hypothetical protein
VNAESTNSLPPVPSSAPRVGRPRALNEAKRREICDLIFAGCALDAAARYVGCAACTVRREADRDPQFAQLLQAAALDAKRVPSKLIREFVNRYVQIATQLKAQAKAQNRQPACRLLRPDQLAEIAKMASEDLAGGATLERLDKLRRDSATFPMPVGTTDFLRASTDAERAKPTNFAPIAANRAHRCDTPNAQPGHDLRPPGASPVEHQNPSRSAPKRAKVQNEPMEKYQAALP